MNLFAFELGRQKDLCFAELVAVLGEKSLFERNLDTAIFRLDKVIPQELQDRLGGTIKIVEIFDEIDSGDKKQLHNDIEKKFTRCIKDEFTGSSGKIPFSVSTLSFYNQRDIDIKRLLTSSKKTLKSLGLNSRFVNKNFRNTKPSTIYKAKVVQKGIDLNVIKGEKKIFLGKTIAVQDIDSYTKRDFDKPGRDAKVGMLPPKLAQIMINLAGPSKTIYDPFCGTGTVLTEGILMGKNVIGSDMDERMVEYSQKNCDWFMEEFAAKIPRGSAASRSAAPSHKIFQADARFLTKKDLPIPPDAIITEGYLGKPLTKFPSPQEAEKIFRELANLHVNWLTAIKKITNCPIVMCATAFKHDNKTVHLPRFEEIAKTAGYKIIKSFTYARPDQIVARDIHILK